VAACSSGGEDDSNQSVDVSGAGGSFGVGAGSTVNSGTGNTVNPGPGGAVNAGAGGAVPPGPGCGNGALDPGEECDGAIAPTCAAATMNTMPSGTLTCSACRVDTSGCSSASGAGGSTVGTGGSLNTGNVPNNTGGMGLAGAGNASGGAPSTDGLDALRQICVDTINQYRATVNLPPLSRAIASQESCSDQGAERDASTGRAHGSAGTCPGLGAQNTCPGWNPDWYGGEAGALRSCLEAMWNEGEPPVPRDQCTGQCFQTYGHYLNMTSGASVVSCGFYRMPNGEIWMNQDFGR
jgi:hypothetical protein